MDRFCLFEKYNKVTGHQRSKIERIYLEEYKKNLANLTSKSGYTCRLLFSPISKILSVHFFYLKKPLTNTQLIDDLNSYRNSYILSGTNQEFYISNENEGEDSSIEDHDPIPQLTLTVPKVFLKRNLKMMQKLQEENISMHNGISTYLSSKVLKLRYNQGQTDIIQRRKRPAKKGAKGKKSW